MIILCDIILKILSFVACEVQYCYRTLMFFSLMSIEIDDHTEYSTTKQSKKDQFIETLLDMNSALLSFWKELINDKIS